jgi:hypothetical protein
VDAGRVSTTAPDLVLTPPKELCTGCGCPGGLGRPRCMCAIICNIWYMRVVPWISKLWNAYRYVRHRESELKQPWEHWDELFMSAANLTEFQLHRAGHLHNFRYTLDHEENTPQSDETSYASLCLHMSCRGY